MVVGGVGLGILGPFMIDIISSGQEVKAFFAQWIIGIFLVLFGGPMNAWLVGKIDDNIYRRHSHHPNRSLIFFTICREVPCENSPHLRSIRL
jgi:hypothetical protein